MSHGQQSILGNQLLAKERLYHKVPFRTFRSRNTFLHLFSHPFTLGIPIPTEISRVDALAPLTRPTEIVFRVPDL